ncbi:nucleotidyltransferase [Thermodesulfobacteriota bacterium]
MSTNYDWESTFRQWAAPPGKTERDRCANAEQATKNAISKNPKLKSRNIKIFTQGSYRNNTNVKKDSDVDIGVLCYNTFFYNLPEGYSKDDFNIIDATYHFSDFKNEVQEALVDYFSKNSVHRGNKSFDIKENSYHVDADVTPFFEHRRYDANGTYESGVELYADNGASVINWPEQHYNNGVSKNNTTGRRYKSLVRILKSLCNEMVNNGSASAKPIPGFLNECLIWNVPNDDFGHSTYWADVRACLAHLFNNTRDNKDCSEWGEVSELKYLFRGPQKWTRSQAHQFISDAWDYIGFE